VDAQVDFVHEDGALSVPGAVADTRRTIEWIYRHLGEITTIAASLDSHLPVQIFYPAWWVNHTGEHPAPFTLISWEDIETGRWFPTREKAWSETYVRLLETQAKKVLTIWPYHTMIGTSGHQITPALYESMIYHSAVRDSQPILLNKGSIAKTEHYSILEPEVKVPENPLGMLNMDFINLVHDHDLVYIAGQAKSHCVLETVHSLVNHFGETNPDLLKRLRLLEDATSSVVHPDIDFDAMAREAFFSFQAKGIQLTSTQSPLG
jgi:nicotinamidase-related amidase